MSANPSAIEPEAIVPFWNRLREIILYPAHGASMANIVVLALCTLVVFLPFKIMALVLLLLVNVAMYRYAFECLRATANGQLTPPEGGFLSTTDKSLGWKLIGLLFIIGVLAGVGIVLFGPRLGIVWLLFLGLCMPAAVMVLAMEESVGAAINPGKWFSIIGRIGWSYLAVVGLCLAVLMSEGFGQNLVAKVMPLAVALVAVSLISNYCLVIMFHLMGYLLYQYHDEVGYVPDAPQTLQRPLAQLDPDQELLDRASAMVREGRPEDATMLLGGRLKASGGTPAVHAQYRKLLNLVRRQGRTASSRPGISRRAARAGKRQAGARSAARMPGARSEFRAGRTVADHASRRKSRGVGTAAGRAEAARRIPQALPEEQGHSEELPARRDDHVRAHESGRAGVRAAAFAEVDVSGRSAHAADRRQARRNPAHDGDGQSRKPKPATPA